MRSIVVILFFIVFSASAVDKAPLVLRACIDFDDQKVTLMWNPVQDACGSFTSYDIYENINGGVYTKIASVPMLAADQYVHPLPDLDPDRCYFIRVKLLCDMLDSAQSNTVCVDQSFPSMTEIDSVSYDLLTQDIVVGWSSNPTPDTRGYQIYNFTGGIGDSIGYTNQTSFIASTSPAAVFPITIATNDSCNLYAPLSSPHTVSYLTSTIDTCARQINLTWSLYKGWANIDSQVVMASLNGQPFTRLTSLNNLANSLIINGITLGDTLCYYIRSYTFSSSLVTSSSNKVCIETRALEVPGYVYLNNVSVVNNQDVELIWTLDNIKDQKAFEVNRSDYGGTPSFYATVASDDGLSYMYIDNSADVANQAYSYQISSVNKCDEISATTLISNSIHLRILPLTSHTTYINWDGGVERYELEFQPSGSSTWNNHSTYSILTHVKVKDSVGCFRAVAYEAINSYGQQGVSYSNETCVEPELTYYVPTAINPLSGYGNNKFVVKGNGINHRASHYTILNRWGEIIANNPTDVAWDAIYKDQTVPQGIYIYILHIRGVRGENETEKGTINVVR